MGLILFEKYEIRKSKKQKTEFIEWIKKQDFYDKLVRNRLNDIQKGYTTTGIHRDDFMIYINNRPVSIFGSQGQQRTTILTLKLCELKIVKEEIDAIIQSGKEAIEKTRCALLIELVYGV